MEPTVVVLAQRQEPRQVGVPAVVPLVEVVRLRGRDVTIAARDRAAPIHGAQRPPLISVGESSRAAEVEADRIAERGDQIVERRHRPTLPDDHPVAIDHDGDEPHPTRRPTDQVAQRVDGQVDCARSRRANERNTVRPGCSSITVITSNDGAPELVPSTGRPAPSPGTTRERAVDRSARQGMRSMEASRFGL
jgi:hypothetical protein